MNQTPPSPINPDLPQPIFNQIKNYILSRIACGELKAHDRLPSEREYEALLGASRQTVRRALDELVIKGILYRLPGKGTYVSERPADLRLVGVTASITMLALSPEHVFRTRVLESTACPPFASRLLGIPEGEAVVHLEQITFVRDEPRYIHHSYLPRQIGASLLAAPLPEASILEILFLLRTPLPAVSRDHLSPGTANAEEAELLAIPPNFAVQVQRGVIFAADGKPMEAHKIIIRGDRFKQTIEYALDQKVIEQITRRSGQTTE